MAKKKNDQVELTTGKTAKAAKGDAAAAAKPEATAKAKAEKVRAESTLIRRALPGLLIVLLLWLAIAGGVYFFADKAVNAQRAALIKLYRQHYVSLLDNYVRDYEAVVKAPADAELLAYMQPLAEPDMGLTAHFPGALYARVVPITLDPAIPNGLSYAHQDMVLRLAAGKKVPPEISFHEQATIKAKVVSYARALRDASGAPAAVLLISFPFTPLENALKSFAPDAGRVELIQKNGQERASILVAGEGEAEENAELATSNPGWDLSFAPAAELANRSAEVTIILILCVLAAVLAVGIFLWLLLGLQRHIKEDVQAIDGFCDNYFRYGNRQRPQMHFAEAASLLGKLEQYGKELRADKVVSKPADGLGEFRLSPDDTSRLLGEVAAKPAARAPLANAKADVPATTTAPGVNPDIFRAYDIRGVVGKDLTPEVAQALGRAIGSEAAARGESVVVVGRDGRLSGPELAAALIEGLRASGRDVIDVGMVPTPVLYFAAKTVGSGSGVMVTGSHNPPDYNGFKIMVAGDTLAGDAIQSLYQRIENGDFSRGSGGLSQLNVAADYIDRVASDVAMARPLTVVVDAGNGVAGAIGPRVLEALGCNVIPLFCEVDGNFPNHHPDPSKPENLQDLMAAVAANNADIGIAFDGDGDRVGVVTAAGKNIFADRLMMLYAKHVLTTNPGADIIFDVKCTRDLPALISRHGGRPIMCKTGHSFIKAKLKETGAALAGEMSGHVFFNDRWFGFDDGIYSAARLLEILSLEAGSSDEVFAEFPENPSTPEINIAVADAHKFALMQTLQASANFPDANVITLDGLRVEFNDGWGLVRASNTTPCLVARFEGKTEAALAAVQEKFRTLLLAADASLKLPF